MPSNMISIKLKYQFDGQQKQFSGKKNTNKNKKKCFITGSISSIQNQ